MAARHGQPPPAIVTGGLMPAPKTPEKRALWLARLSEASLRNGNRPPMTRRYGEANHAWKDGLSTVRAFTCEGCGQAFYAKRPQGQRFCSHTCQALFANPFKGRQHSEETRMVMSANHADVAGANNPGWRDGSSKRQYRPGFVYAAALAKERDGFMCQRCKATPPARLHVHHMDFAKTDHSLGNLITLCGSCHTKEHWSFFKREGFVPAGAERGWSE